METINSINLQKLLFDPIPIRKNFLTFFNSNVEKNFNDTTSISVNVWRNHTFELFSKFLDPFLVYQKLKFNYNISGYDNTFSFIEHSPADLEILWLDPQLILNNTDIDFDIWICEKIKKLKQITKNPILLITWDENNELEFVTKNHPDIYITNLKKISTEHNCKLFENRLASITGSYLSKEIFVPLALELSAKYIPTILGKNIKGICVDLDNTLYQGVLGEDGEFGIQISSHHKILQTFLKKLSENGVFLTLVSKNNHNDVEKLFNNRLDFTLNWSDFIIKKISWQEKFVSIKEIANELRIGIDSLIFVDDNIGELLSAKNNLPELNVVLATEDAYFTQRSLEFYPGLQKLKVSVTDQNRIKDFLANTKRDEILSKKSIDQYYKDLNVTLTIIKNESKHLERLSSLCNKTNQFNLSLSRFKDNHIYNLMNSKNSDIMGVSLTDALSDSGIISVLICSKENNVALVNELCISCRAMGRKLEDTIILQSLLNLSFLNQIDKIGFKIRKGPKNKPAIDWLSNILNKEIVDDGIYYIDKEFLINYTFSESIKVIK